MSTPLSSVHYLSPDGTTFIPVAVDFKKANLTRSPFSTINLIRTYGLAAASTNLPFCVADEFGQKTWKFMVMPDGSLANAKPFAEEGEAGIAVDLDGNVYVAAGNIAVFDRSGRRIDMIDVPERPTSLAFGGKDRQTLSIAARSSLYEVRTKFKGQ